MDTSSSECNPPPPTPRARTDVLIAKKALDGVCYAVGWQDKVRIHDEGGVRRKLRQRRTDIAALAVEDAWAPDV